MSTRRGIRYRLATVILLGVLTSALSLFALVQLLSTSTANRSERAHEAVVETLDRIAQSPARIGEPASTNIVGLHGGVFPSAKSLESAPRNWVPDIELLLAEPLDPMQAHTIERPFEGGLLVLGARPVPSGIAWSGFEVRPLASLRTWRWIVILLALATALLVVSALYIVVTMHRGARALGASLRALGADLDAPIARPQVRELSDVAEGIAQLAERLSQARREEARLGRELARQERLVALGRVVAGVAHEVRNPLASIKLRLDLAVVDGQRGSPDRRLPPAAESAIAHASSEIARLDRLVADLLVVAGGAPGTKRNAPLGALARARVDALAPWAKERDVQLSVEGDATAFLHEDAVARAIDNLLRNAVEASPRGAQVTVRLRTKIQSTGDVAELDVEDRGVGVAGDRAVELFEPFFTTKSDGSGLGLALSRSIARSHGGDVAYFRANERTHFVLTLATFPGAATSSSSAAARANARGSGATDGGSERDTGSLDDSANERVAAAAQ